MGRYETEVFAEVIAEEKDPDVWSENVGEEMGEGVFAGGGRTGDAEQEDGRLG